VSFDFGQALREGSIVLVSLATEGGTVSQENASTFATLMLADLWTGWSPSRRDDGSAVLS
jgi:hypothetical protein